MERQQDADILSAYRLTRHTPVTEARGKKADLQDIVSSGARTPAVRRATEALEALQRVWPVWYAVKEGN
jgi:hypothetical protein